MKNSLSHVKTAVTTLAIISGLAISVYAADKAMQAKGWSVHSLLRPKPVVVAPADTLGLADAPADAIILFDGKNLDQWKSDNGDGPANWEIADGYIEANRTGGIHTAKEFGNCQLHIEWATPEKVEGHSQERGNSGVFFMGRYELQILDSYENPTYADGQAGSLYGQQPPLVNVCRAPGKWQSFDVCFMRPIFAENGELVRPARISVFQNGVCIHNNYEIKGLTYHRQLAKYIAHGDKGPVSLQDHHNPTRFRNIWIRPLAEEISSSEPYNESEK